MSDAEWGPWIEHDGKGCPVPVGTKGDAELRCGRIVPFCAGMGSTRGGPYKPSKFRGTSAWEWGGKPANHFGEEVIRYRVRKPRGLTILENLIADLPATASPKVDA